MASRTSGRLASRMHLSISCLTSRNCANKSWKLAHRMMKSLARLGESSSTLKTEGRPWTAKSLQKHWGKSDFRTFLQCNCSNNYFSFAPLGTESDAGEFIVIWLSHMATLMENVFDPISLQATIKRRCARNCDIQPAQDSVPISLLPMSGSLEKSLEIRYGEENAMTCKHERFFIPCSSQVYETTSITGLPENLIICLMRFSPGDFAKKDERVCVVNEYIDMAPYACKYPFSDLKKNQN